MEQTNKRLISYKYMINEKKGLQQIDVSTEHEKEEGEEA